MSSEKRMLLAVGLSFLILALYPAYLRWIAPSRVEAPQSVEGARDEEPARKSLEITGEKIVAAEAEDLPAENVFHFSHKHFNVEFSSRGGAITKLELKNRRKGQADEILVNRSKGGRGAFEVAVPNQGIDFGEHIFSLEALNEQKGEVRLTSEEPGQWRLVKVYRFVEDLPAFWLELELTNLSAGKQLAALKFTSQLGLAGHVVENYIRPESFVFLGDKLVSTKLDKIEKKPYVIEGRLLWTALARKYFALIVHPEQPASLAKTTVGLNHSDSFLGELQMAPEELDPSQTLKLNVLIYAGPQYYQDLKYFGLGFERILSHGVFGAFRLWFFLALYWTHKLVGNYGWAIVLITCLIKLLFTPFTHMSFESMKKMSALQPQLKALQERFKDDQARLSKETMELYRKNRVNPMGGCLPMVLQIPIFIAFYQVLAQAVELKGEPFIFWIRDLSEPDRAWTLPFSLPFLGDAVNILPLLMLGSMVWQQKLTPQTGTPEQQKVMMIMPLMFGFVFYRMPSGLVLYWFVNNMLSIFHQLFVKGKALPHHQEQ